MLMLLVASFLASSSVGNKTSQVAKLLLQMYFPGMPALFKVSSKFSLFKLASLLVLMSVTTNDSVFGSTACTNSGIGKISFSLKYLAYLFTLSLSSSDGFFFCFCICVDQETAFVGVVCPGGIVEDNDKSSGFGEGSMSMKMS